MSHSFVLILDGDVDLVVFLHRFSFTSLQFSRHLWSVCFVAPGGTYYTELFHAKMAAVKSKSLFLSVHGDVTADTEGC